MTKWLKENKCPECEVVKRPTPTLRRIREKIPTFYKNMREGYSPEYSAKLAGFDLVRFRKRLDEDPEFREIMEQYKKNKTRYGKY